jgi:ABC-type phosphate transport system substrate-binding protein
MIRAVAMVLLLASATGSASPGGFKVVVHPSNDVSSLTNRELSAYLLKRKVTWPDGTPVVPVDQAEKSAVRQAVLRDVFARSASAIKSYWHQQIFSGRAVPPVEKASDQQVVAFIQASPGAIGYVSESANVGNLRVVAIR